MNKLELLLKQLHETPETVAFDNVIEIIDSYYQYTPVRFSNGPVDGEAANYLINDAGKNEGSCKIFSFAQLHQLNEKQTLYCFGTYYRDDVLKHPGKNDHANIRNFIKNGWQHIRFDNTALVLKP